MVQGFRHVLDVADNRGAEEGADPEEYVIEECRQCVEEELNCAEPDKGTPEWAAPCPILGATAQAWLR